MEGGWDDLHCMNPWSAKEDIVRKVKINDMEQGLLYDRPNHDREIYYAGGFSFCIIIGFNSDDVGV